MNRTMLKSKIHSCGGDDPGDLDHYYPRVVDVDAHNQIRTIDNEVATLLGAPTSA
ncbi:MAG: hypothetical protein ACLPV4_09710 [Solirubrobacteraceae bacterium]